MLFAALIVFVLLVWGLRSWTHVVKTAADRAARPDGAVRRATEALQRLGRKRL